jgi:hypothetical protein
MGDPRTDPASGYATPTEGWALRTIVETTQTGMAAIVERIDKGEDRAQKRHDQTTEIQAGLVDAVRSLADGRREQVKVLKRLDENTNIVRTVAENLVKDVDDLKASAAGPLEKAMGAVKSLGRGIKENPREALIIALLGIIAAGAVLLYLYLGGPTP